MRIVAVISCLFIFASCYNQRKAQKEFARAAAAFPPIAAGYCATTYPVKERIIKGKDSLVIDTTHLPGDTITEVFYYNDTVYKYINKTTPGKTITIYKTRIDTFIREDRAALAYCEMNKNKISDMLNNTTKQAASWRAKAKKRFWIIAGAASLFILGLIYRVKKYFKNANQYKRQMD